EVVAGNFVTPDALVVAATTQTQRHEAIDEQTREHVVAIAKVFVVWIGEGGHRIVLAADGDGDDLVGPIDRQRAQHYRVHETEDGGIGANPERERDHSDRDKSRPLN